MNGLIKCEDCKYNDDCPAGWSYCNSACLIIQREKEDYQKKGYKEEEDE